MSEIVDDRGLHTSCHGSRARLFRRGMSRERELPRGVQAQIGGGSSMKRTIAFLGLMMLVLLAAACGGGPGSDGGADGSSAGADGSSSGACPCPKGMWCLEQQCVSRSEEHTSELQSR